jgi:dolichol kinase
VKKELFRQAFHLILGLLIICFTLLLGKTITIILVLLALIFSLITSIYLIKSNKSIPGLNAVLETCERNHEKTIPLKAIHFFLIGALIALIFPLETALTALIVLSIGDATSTLIGLKFGRIKFKGKSIEGTIAGTIISSIAVYLLIHNPITAIIASSIGMLAELLIYKIDDSITIPTSVGIIVTMIKWF